MILGLIVLHPGNCYSRKRSAQYLYRTEQNRTEMGFPLFQNNAMCLRQEFPTFSFTMQCTWCTWSRDSPLSVVTMQCTWSGDYPLSLWEVQFKINFTYCCLLGLITDWYINYPNIRKYNQMNWAIFWNMFRIHLSLIGNTQGQKMSIFDVVTKNLNQFVFNNADCLLQRFTIVRCLKYHLFYWIKDK